MRSAFPSLFARFRELSSTRRTLLALFALCTGWLLISWIARPTFRPGLRSPSETPSTVGFPGALQPDAELKAQWQRMKESPKLMIPAPASSAAGTLGLMSDSSEFGRPLIAHAAELAVATKEFSRSRTTLEEILERHHGYAAKLRMVGQPTGGLLTATLRVPSAEFNGAVSDLKTLGNVEREEQSADEITQQRADLEARLVNAQSTLAHLQGILAKNSKGSNLVELQRQLSGVNAEIARLEAERVASEHRVIFANVLFSLREEIPPPVESLVAQLRNAGVTGFSDALSSLSGIVIFVVSRGPVILVWVLLVFFPARWIWGKREQWMWEKGELRRKCRGDVVEKRRNNVIVSFAAAHLKMRNHRGVPKERREKLVVCGIL